MKKSDRGLFEAAISLWGEGAQKDQAIEEAAELIVALRHDARGRPSTIIEEVADMSIMLDQIKMMCGEDEIEEAREDKIIRLRARIKRVMSSTQKDITNE